MSNGRLEAQVQNLIRDNRRLSVGLNLANLNINQLVNELADKQLEIETLNQQIAELAVTREPDKKADANKDQGAS